jgi:hypothetical protein
MAAPAAIAGPRQRACINRARGRSGGIFATGRRAQQADLSRRSAARVRGDNSRRRMTMKTSAAMTLLFLTTMMSTRSEAFPVYESEVYNSTLVQHQGDGSGYQEIRAYCGSDDFVVGGSCWTDDSTASLTQSGASSSSSWLCSWNNHGSSNGYRKIFARCAHAGAGTTQWETSKWYWAGFANYANGSSYDPLLEACDGDGSFGLGGGCSTVYSPEPALVTSGAYPNGWYCAWNDYGSSSLHYSWVKCQRP